jgi:hypothetical protein
MFAALASRRVSVHGPRLPLPVDEMTLLSNHINPDHTRALPGYSVGKVIGEGGFCQVSGSMNGQGTASYCRQSFITQRQSLDLPLVVRVAG